MSAAWQATQAGRSSTKTHGRLSARAIPTSIHTPPRYSGFRETEKTPLVTSWLVGRPGSVGWPCCANARRARTMSAAPTMTRTAPPATMAGVRTALGMRTVEPVAGRWQPGKGNQRPPRRSATNACARHLLVCGWPSFPCCPRARSALLHAGALGTRSPRGWPTALQFPNPTALIAKAARKHRRRAGDILDPRARERVHVGLVERSIGRHGFLHLMRCACVRPSCGDHCRLDGVHVLNLPPVNATLGIPRISSRRVSDLVVNDTKSDTCLSRWAIAGMMQPNSTARRLLPRTSPRRSGMGQTIYARHPIPWMAQAAP